MQRQKIVSALSSSFSAEGVRGFEQTGQSAAVALHHLEGPGRLPGGGGKATSDRKLALQMTLRYLYSTGGNLEYSL